MEAPIAVRSAVSQAVANDQSRRSLIGYLRAYAENCLQAQPHVAITVVQFRSQSSGEFAPLPTSLFLEAYNSKTPLTKSTYIPVLFESECGDR
jgi:hypothetical protein